MVSGSLIRLFNHSGGARGSDIEWAIQGSHYGVVSRHYWLGSKTPYGNTEVSVADAREGQKKATIAARQMGRIAPTHQIRNQLIIRNWCQVKYSDAVFAISTMLTDLQVSGGTGYACQMAINENKPVWLFDQIKEKWLLHKDGNWQRASTPTLTEHFAGIGTRQLNDVGALAIRDVYRATFGC